MDPVLDVLPSVADVSSDTEPRRSFSPVPPLVEGGHRHPQVVGEILHTEEAVGSFHDGILRVDAFIPIAESLSSTLQLRLGIPVTTARSRYRDDRRMTGSRTLRGQGCRLVDNACRSQNRFQIDRRTGFTCLLPSGIPPDRRQEGRRHSDGRYRRKWWSVHRSHDGMAPSRERAKDPRRAEIEVKSPQAMISLMSTTTVKLTAAVVTASAPMMPPTVDAPRAPTLSKDTRPCNELRPVDWLTREVA